jgi:hypothetical protein
MPFSRRLTVRPDRRQPDRSTRSRQARSCRRPLCRASRRRCRLEIPLARQRFDIDSPWALVWRSAHGRFDSADQLPEVSGIGPSLARDPRRQAYARHHLSGHPPDPEARCGTSGSDSGCHLMCQVSRHVILVCERFSRPRYDMEDIINSIHDVALYATGSRSNLTRARHRDHYSPSLSSSTRGWSRQSAPAAMRRAPLTSNMASWHRHLWPAGSGRCPQHAASRAGRVSRRLV